MTIHEVSTQLFDLSIGGQFNGEFFTEDELEDYISDSFSSSTPFGDRLLMEISLPDGYWMFTINRYSDEEDGFDYTIPDTRSQEDSLWSMFCPSYEGRWA